MEKIYFNKETLVIIGDMAISAGAVAASILMMFIIFITSIVLIGIVLG